MGKKGVEDMINEIEVFLEQCNYQTFSQTKIVVPKEELNRMLNELKLKLPSELERCKKIMRNKEAILASARTRSDAIISESVNEANKMVDNNRITQLANQRANDIVESARQQAEEIVAAANQEAKDVRLGAMNYTKSKVAEMKDFLAATLEAEKENYRNLTESLENNIFTLETNLNEVDASIDLINNDIPSGQEEYAEDDYEDATEGSVAEEYPDEEEEDSYDDVDDEDSFDDDDDDFLDDDDE